MSEFKLVLGTKNYSSWSLRPWILLKQFGIPFSETILTVQHESFPKEIQRYSRAGKVPVLIDGVISVWDSLSIAEYVAEAFPEKHLWPQDSVARAKARSITAEMHSGFLSLRQNCIFNFTGRFNPPVSEAVEKDVHRIVEIWEECIKEFGGPFLFGKEFCVADAFYAPIVSRFTSYNIPISSEIGKKYMSTIQSLPSYQEWSKLAVEEMDRAKSN
ncbi:glutathione S-transferase [Leptospira perolatii]|uniref:Glutathione S-transferase n=1 Tax=Leptospira perolatii TaxID=2023191 RepID=A0A2M9ZSE4_9LEPT|nr:glutathione S-transferase family protein [Leptospira perolatii]PJZ71465.1 glutathione S-transferase [Leptospira perolatii]PJZ75000.1 glutathione S-transferase [Leptospira perolatii]